MANLNGINMDANVQESTGEFTVLPAGKYKACLVSDQLRDNKQATGKILEVKIQIMEGQFAGEVLTDYINITNPSSKAQAIGQGTLKRICNLCGVPYPPQDTAGLMGKPLEVDVKVGKFTSNTTGKELESNKIRAYGPVPTQQTQAQPAPQALPSARAQQASGW